MVIFHNNRPCQIIAAERSTHVNTTQVTIEYLFIDHKRQAHPVGRPVVLLVGELDADGGWSEIVETLRRLEAAD
jgi:hypothetical protein